MNEEPTLSETAFRVYLFFIKNNPREITRARIQEHFALSKSTVNHHLNHLKKLGLIENSGLGYKLKNYKPIGILRSYILIHKFLIPRPLISFAFFIIGSVLLLMPIEGIPFLLKVFGYLASILGIVNTLYNYYRTRI